LLAQQTGNGTQSKEVEIALDAHSDWEVVGT
jgi:hypothetical protein